MGGVLFRALHGGTTYHRSVAYGLWIAAALLLLAMPVAGSRRFYRRTSLPLIEGWVFVTASIVLTVAGAAIDALGT